MSRRRAASTWSPLLCGLLLLGIGRTLRQPRPAAPRPGAPAMALPLPHVALDGSNLAVDLQLDAGPSSVRAVARDTLRQHTAHFDRPRGHLQCAADGAPQQLEFTVPLGALAPTPGHDGDDDEDRRQQVLLALGARADDSLQFSGRSLRVCKLPYDGLFAVTWSGRLRLGHRESHVEIEFWSAALQPGAARLQTVLAIDPIAFVLPSRCCLGPFRERSAVEFGLDLAFRAGGR